MYCYNIVPTDLEEDFERLPKNQSVVLNDTHSIKVKINCIPPEGDPTPTVSWRHRFYNGTIVSVSEDERFKIRMEWLAISNVQSIDGGYYQCVANNGYYERLSPFVFLNVLPSKL